MKINSVILCWCSDNGVAIPMDTKNGNFKCPKCKTEVSLKLFDEEGIMLKTEEEL